LGDTKTKHSGFDGAHTFNELRIVCGTIGTGVNASMAIGTERDHMCGMVRAAVADTTQMMVARGKVCRPSAKMARENRIPDTSP
jgi:hypothetical protein